MHRQLDCHPRHATRHRTRLFSILGLAGLASCMTRPVSREEPTTVTPVVMQLTQRTIDKIDLLFMIDDSASMADKQEYLKLAIPDLIHRLVVPNCVDDNDGSRLGQSTLDASGTPQCAKGSLEFPPVHDLHIGVVSSSLGGNGGDQCLTDAGNDRGRLIARTGSKKPIAEAAPSSFLAFQPAVLANQGKAPPEGVSAITSTDTLATDFEDVIAGVGQSGCGLEAQLESWYRFLIQPDPYQDIKAGGVLEGVDSVVLKQRHDFLRPDSLLAIIDVTDENDSEIDVRWNKAYGANFDDSRWIPAHASKACATDPFGSDCHSCDEDGHAKDPGCETRRYSTSAANITDYDNMNLRHVRMKQRYGIEPQFPLSRYVNGLREAKVPDRDGEYPAGARTYVGNAECTNPLFAAELPDGSDTSHDALCNLKPSDPGTGARRKEMVIYAHIGGVPNQLLMDAKTNAPKSTLADADWQKILGRDPERYDFTGIDPHMIESVTPRDGLAGPTSADDADPVHGREWDTSHDSAGSDLQYACTFALPKAKDCAGASDTDGCDCPTKSTTDHAGIPPLCDPSNPTQQIKAKTYPTTRELLLAKKMGAQGVVASLCPIHTKDNASGTDPLFGYRPAVASLVDVIAGFFVAECLPHKLAPNRDGKLPCLALEIEPKPGPQSACADIPGRVQPDAAVLARFRKDHPEASNQPICEVSAIPDTGGASCKSSKTPGWCYVEGANAPGACDQALEFSAAGTPQDLAQLTIQCFEEAAPPKD